MAFFKAIPSDNPRIPYVTAAEPEAIFHVSEFGNEDGDFIRGAQKWADSKGFILRTKLTPNGEWRVWDNEIN
jgi:hypothetical protein